MSELSKLLGKKNPKRPITANHQVKAGGAQKDMKEQISTAQSIEAQQLTELAAEVPTSGTLDVPKEFSHESQPDSLTPEQVADFRESITVLENNLDHKELVGNAISNILNKLKENPNFRELLLPEDCGTMVKALRESYGVAVTKKTARVKTKSASAKEVDDIVDSLGDLDIVV